MTTLFPRLQEPSPSKMTTFLRVASIFLLGSQSLIGGILSWSHYHDRRDALSDRSEVIIRFLEQTTIPPQLKISDINLGYFLELNSDAPSPLYATVSNAQGALVASYLELNDPILLDLHTQAQEKHQKFSTIIENLEQQENIIEVRKPILVTGKFLGVLTIGYSRQQMLQASFSYGLQFLFLCLISDIFLILLYRFYAKKTLQELRDQSIVPLSSLSTAVLPNASASAPVQPGEFSLLTQEDEALQYPLGQLIDRLQRFLPLYHSPAALAAAQQEALLYLKQVIECLVVAQQNSLSLASTNPVPAVLSPSQYFEDIQREKNEFFAMIGHEMRTPLNAVTGMTRLLADTPLNPQQQEFVNLIRNSGDTLLMMINNILDFSKIESGKLELEQYFFDLRHCIEEVLKLFVSQCADKPVELGYLIEPQTPVSIMGDATRLRQILINLVGNALKFTHQGEVVVYVRAQMLTPDPIEISELEEIDNLDLHQYEIRFAIKDTGIGIPPDRLERLFKTFSQIDASTTRKYGGTGLGLVISKRLCELMGGKIWVHSEENYGSTFYFTILTKATKPQNDFNTSQMPNELTGKRLLIVDDNVTNQKILTQQAQSLGIFTCAVESGEKALEWLKQGVHFDIAILDMGISQQNELELARQIRQQPGYHNLPLLLISSITSSQVSLELEDLHYVRVLNKPIQQSELYKSLLHIVAETPIKMTPKKSLPVETSVPAKTPALKILVAEDVAVNQAVIRLLLSKLGYQADIVSNGREALKALHHRNYDVVLMDVRMPDMDGLTTTHHIYQEIFPRPRIIAMTAEAMPGDKESCLAAGMDDYLSKPISIDLLQQALLRCIPLSVE